MKLHQPLAVAALTATAVAFPSCTSETSAMADKPNIIVIMADDMRVDDLQAMPNTRHLLGAQDGLGATYNNSWASTPLCCPSRATLLTGQYSHNHGVLENLGPNGGSGAFDDSSTLATWLNPTYQTVMVGKYMNEFGSGEVGGTPPGYVPPGWDHFVALTEPNTGNYTDFNINNDGVVSHATDRYQTTFFGNRMVDEVNARIGGGPLFMWASFHAPHTGGGDSRDAGLDDYVPLTSKYRGLSDVGLPASPAVDEARIGDKPPWVRALPRLTDAVKDQTIRLRQERRNALRYVDDEVGEIVAAVTAAGELDNTVFVFTSDNGMMLGEHRITDGKVYPYLESAKVPLLIRGPGFTPGTHTEPVSNVDLAPTIAALAGVTPGLAVDGMNLLDPIPSNRPILLESYATFEDFGMPTYSGVVQNSQQYVEYAGGQKELYGLVSDPWQEQNQIGSTTTKMRNAKTRLKTILDGLR